MTALLVAAAVLLLSRSNQAPPAPSTQYYNSTGYAYDLTSTDAGQPPPGKPNPLEVFLGGTETGKAVTEEIEEKKKLAEEVARLAREGGTRAAAATDQGVAWLVRHLVP